MTDAVVFWCFRFISQNIPSTKSYTHEIHSKVGSPGSADDDLNDSWNDQIIAANAPTPMEDH